MPKQITIEEIGQMDEESKEAGIPVFKAECLSGSFMKFGFLNEPDGLSVFEVESVQYGDFKRLMNRVIDQFQAGQDTHVTFMNYIGDYITGRDLLDALDGFEQETWEAEEGPFEGQDYEVLQGVWQR